MEADDFPRYEDYPECHYCGGEGSVEVHRPQWDDPYFCEVVRCEHCNGSGYLYRGWPVGGGPTEDHPNRPYCKPDQSCCDFCCGN